MNARRRRVIILLALPLAACSARSLRPDAVLLYHGAYEFSGQVSAEPVAGTIRFEEHAWFIQSNHGASGLMEDLLARPVRARVVCRCGGRAMQFRVRNGEFDRGAQASVAKTAQAGTRQECVRYETAARGRRYCAQTAQVPVESTVVRAGVLDVSRVGV